MKRNHPPMKKGETIIPVVNQEFHSELRTFLEAYEQAANSCDFNKIAPFIDQDATFIFTNGVFNGIAAIRHAFEETWQHIREETYSLLGSESHVQR